MNLYLNRKILLDDQADGIVQIITETRRWSKGWVARLNSGERQWIQHSDTHLSNAGYGLRIFTIAEPGSYEAESVCASFKSHRVRFDVLSGGVIVLRQSTYPYRCGHLRRIEAIKELEQKMVGADQLTMISSLSINDESWQAAILIGGILENHLRRMCEDRGLSTGSPDWSKGIDGLSAALKKTGVYSTEQHKEVIGLAYLRKRAQHSGDAISQIEIEAALVQLHRFLKAFPVSTPV